MEKEKAFFLNLKKRISQKGAVFYTGKFAYAIDIIAFEKKDGSGDLTCWLQPKDMDQIKAQGNTVISGRQYPSSQGAQGQTERPRVIPNAAPNAQPRPKVTPRQEYAENEEQVPWPDQDPDGMNF